MPASPDQADDESPGKSSSPAGFRRVGQDTVFRGSLITVSTATFEAPDGSRFERDVVQHPGAVVVVPITDRGGVLMVRQFRAAIDHELLELPAGKRDVEGEPTEVTARRELVEEVGRRAGRLDLLARFYNSPGFCDEHTWLYLARDLEEVPHDRQGTEEQHMSVEEVPLGEVSGLIERMELVDAKSIIGVVLAIQRLARLE